MTLGHEDIGACVFDAYGTLFDVNAAAEKCRDELGDKADALSSVWRTKQLEYTWLRSLMGAFEDFWHVTGQSLDYALAKLAIEDAPLRAKLMEMYFRLDAYAEAKGALAAIADAGIKTGILSNGSTSMLVAAVKNAGIERLVDHIFSVDKVGIYKPHPSVYQMAVDGLHEAPERICFLSSNAWDVAGASHFGFRVVWINRFGQQSERLPGAPEHEIKSLSELPALLGL